MLTPEENLEFSIFHPHAAEAFKSIEGGHFVHYTKAEIAQQIIANREFWLRNARQMNDKSELKHGFECLRQALQSDEASQIRDILRQLSSGHLDAFDAAWAKVSSTSHSIIDETYIGSLGNFGRNARQLPDPEGLISHHEHGKLSMWRAYGPQDGAGLVFRADPILEANGTVPLFSSHVVYSDADRFRKLLPKLREQIDANREYVRQMASERLFFRFLSVFCAAIVCTKHPIFQEEDEWRIVYWPKYMGADEKTYASLKSEEVTLNEAPQKIYKISLRDTPSEQMSLNLPTLLDRVLIGPSRSPTTVINDLVKKLVQSGWPKAQAEKIIVNTEIPLVVDSSFSAAKLKETRKA